MNVTDILGFHYQPNFFISVAKNSVQCGSPIVDEVSSIIALIKSPSIAQLIVIKILLPG